MTFLHRFICWLTGAAKAEREYREAMMPCVDLDPEDYIRRSQV